MFLFLHHIPVGSTYCVLKTIMLSVFRFKKKKPICSCRSLLPLNSAKVLSNDCLHQHSQQVSRKKQKTKKNSTKLLYIFTTFFTWCRQHLPAPISVFFFIKKPYVYVDVMSYGSFINSISTRKVSSVMCNRNHWGNKK